jgi:type I restriction enzyme, S subunit
VAKVKALLDRLNATRKRLPKVPSLLKRFRQSVLAAACSGRLTEEWRKQNVCPHAEDMIKSVRETVGRVKTRRDVPEHVEIPEMLVSFELPTQWTLTSVADLLRGGSLLDVKDGNHGANHPKVSEFTESGLPFITAAQVNHFRIDYDTAYKVSGSVLDQLRVGFAKPGDAILTHKGSVGRTALIDRDCVLTPQTTYYRCHPRVLSSRYLVYLLASPQVYGQLAQVMSQTTRDFVPISEQYLLHLIVPPIAEQHEIVRRVEALLARADSIERRLAIATRRVETLTQAILAQAFRGELVPTEAELARREGRDYEPASVLLERIRAERHGQQEVKVARKKKTTPTTGQVAKNTTNPPQQLITGTPTDSCTKQQ